MQSIWGKKFNYKEYSQKSLDLATSLIAENRKIVKREFLKDDYTCHHKELHIGSRFNSNDQILWVLQSHVDEKEFISEPDRYLQQVLLGALSADHWYQFEKQW